MLIGDGGRLQQLVSNLLSNAVKFTPERGAISVLLLKNGERVQLVVKDNGIGIAPEFLPHVFDRFTQADTSAARRAGGLGIGLALVRHIALLHGGQVRADSSGVGRGATFAVEFPAAPASALRPVAGGPAVERRGSTEGALTGLRVWVLDDDPDAHEVATLTLKQAGASVENAHSAVEFAEMLERALPKQPPDILLIDLAMPGEDGFAALRACARSNRPTAPSAIFRRCAHRVHPGRAREAHLRRLHGPRRQADRRAQSGCRDPQRAPREPPRHNARRMIRTLLLQKGSDSLLAGARLVDVLASAAGFALQRAQASFATASPVLPRWLHELCVRAIDFVAMMSKDGKRSLTPFTVKGSKTF